MNNTAELIRRKLNGTKRWGAFCWDQARKSISIEPLFSARLHTHLEN